MTFDSLSQDSLDSLNTALAPRFNWIRNVEQPMESFSGSKVAEGSPIHFDFSEQLLTTLIVLFWADLLSGLVLKWLDVRKDRIIRKVEVDRALQELRFWLDMVFQSDAAVKDLATEKIKNEINARLASLRIENDGGSDSFRTRCLGTLRARLRFHGWPTEEVAEADADKVLSILLNSILGALSGDIKRPSRSRNSQSPANDPTHIKSQERGRVFIGHGRAPYWKELKDFLADRLGLDWEEFNRDAAAGFSTKERLQQMLYSSSFAFLVLAAEDTDRDGTFHARLNVVHELGLFQGRLGFERAIILLEERCEEFSNIRGITQIRFPSGNLKIVFEDIRMVLEREGLIAGRAASGFS